ncbi:unnamed protein product [Nesidiocoris tenuis]|uniref:Uncharacterized protein n=1 Tax=Nesidiocoris tenuis TaxID=355587 RepID=A0A6H5HGH0_9HEMI|nr:unnamed protein product [Nesidiocoris tenuis]
MFASVISIRADGSPNTCCRNVPLNNLRKEEQEFHPPGSPNLNNNHRQHEQEQPANPIVLHSSTGGSAPVNPAAIDRLGNHMKSSTHVRYSANKVIRRKLNSSNQPLHRSFNVASKPNFKRLNPLNVYFHMSGLGFFSGSSDQNKQNDRAV